MSSAVKRACDACHRRKVKCDGVNPCRNCSSAQLSCTYNAIPQKKGPKGSRAKVISELRETQRQTSLAAKVSSRLQGAPCSPSSSALSPTPGLLTSALVKSCVSFFFDNMYTQLPILERGIVEQQVLYMEHNRDSYCLMTSLCAFALMQPGMAMPSSEPYNLDQAPGANIIASQLLIDETLKVRKGYEYIDTVSLNALVTDFFLFGCYYGQELHDRAWYYLREASTMINLVGMHKEEYYMQLEATEASRRRRLFWLVYATERAYAISRHRPLTLQATISFPTVKDDPSDPLAHQLGGYMMLMNLFRPFDDTFTNTWNKARGQVSTQVANGLHKQLNELVQSYLCQDSSFTDLHNNQSWLKSTVWQLTNSNGGNNEDVFQYPASMSRDLLMAMAAQFPPMQGMDLLNCGLIEKLLDVTYSLVEYLQMQPASRDPFTVGPREHLEQILSIIAMSRNGDHRFLGLLLAKVSDLIPRLTTPMLQNAPENPDLANIDIFDGFGTAGIAQPPQQMQLPLDGDYERKFSIVEDYNGTPESSNSGSQGMPQGSDMTSSFVGSPTNTIMSPAMEYPPNMGGYACTPMSEMVINPMGNQPSAMVHGQHQIHHQHNPQQQHQQQLNRGYHMGMPQGNRMSSHPSISSMAPPRQIPQRQGSFQLTHPPQMRTVGDFQGLQGRGTETVVGMGSMNNEIDFGALR